VATLHSDTSAPPARSLRRGTRGRHRARRATLWSLGGLLGAVAVALAVTAVLDARDQRRDPPGELVELSDGRMLHLQVAGAEHVGPTVVLEAGQGLFSPAFAWVQEELAGQATVVAYDRPGYGWSTPADRPVGAAATVDDLHEALTTRALEGPYLLVGHSLGAFYVRTFAERYPDQTLGLVLLDPAHEQQLERLPEDAVAEFEQAGTMFRWAARLARLGLFRLSNPQQDATTDLPPAAAEQIVRVSAAARYWQVAGAEVEAFDAVAAAPPPDLGDLPVMIISAGRDVPDGPPVSEVMSELDRELASRTPRATHHTIDDADHLTLLTDAEHARAASELIAGLLP
jgi:pimeloyl-ACP methyl ester carboxylesterase